LALRSQEIKVFWLEMMAAFWITRMMRDAAVVNLGKRRAPQDAQPPGGKFGGWSAPESGPLEL
jgi:hypothetical protein